MKSGSTWNSLAYWKTGEWQVIEERLKDESDLGRVYCPRRDLLFRSLDLVSAEHTRCVIVGQDPYPTVGHATGVAFSVPESIREGNLPPTLKNIFKEYEDDLHYPAPKNGDLTKWCEQGVLLWNAYPSCALGKPGSHHWLEWEPLTQEILETVDGHAVILLLGGSARSYFKYIHKSPILETSHPSPLGARHGFLGSRIFSRINVELIKLKQPVIDWRLPDGTNNSTKST